MKRRDILLGASSIATAAVIANSQLSTAKQPDPTTTTIAKSTAIAGKNIQIAKDLPGYYVTPAGTGKFPAVIVLMEAFGLNKWCRSICDRLAQSGFAAIAPDFYRGATYAYSDVAGAIAKLKSLDDNAVMSDVGKSIDFLAGKSEINANGIGVVGFCMGGRYAFLTNATYPSKIKAAISFYGGGIDAVPDNQLGQKSLLDRVTAMQSPIMLMYGSEDKMIAADEHGRISTALSKAKKRYILNLFPNAGHGFMSDRRDSYAPAAEAEAWLMTTGFFSQNLKPKRRK
ncbi:dienelactone hydrolase family protein [Chamaesiphon minutus]|uniref:Dienelactone hydrolase-like enzyme n=1 Tax=Chamaesiphon minutus (strain ATCC 27169 / PCC 6605) TaxID=1173020 RepID=K9UB93_CHAP6|nr:dienelactone hydrolase family protein [Chamaesiphon minutus]AFY91494.1 dienelactone hydrolase-like enzyme [Chamaesiphon minutus PCC 6605]